ADPANNTSLQTTTVTVASAAGTVFDDANASGTRDPGEPGLAEVPVFLDANGDGALQPEEPRARTSGDGTYALTGLRSGSNRVCVQVAVALRRIGPACQPVVVLAGDATGVDFALSSDTTAPTTTISLAPAPTSASWSNGDVAVAMVASDNPGGTGVE